MTETRIAPRRNTPVDRQDMLDARERRGAAQRAMVERVGQPLVSFTLNLPGAHKTGELEWICYEEGKALIELVLRESGVELLGEEERLDSTGYELLLAARAPAERLKELMIPIEEGHPLGRLFDIDVIGLDGMPLSGREFGRVDRRCLVCGGPVWLCVRGEAHSHEELGERAEALMRGYWEERFAERVAAQAQRALLTEACISPKPGLVSRTGTGAHGDMDLFTFADSACALGPFFRRVTLAAQRFEGEPEALLEATRFEGMRAEMAMEAATGGVNTHRGAIFSLGLVCAAAGYLHSQTLPVTRGALFFTCERIAGGCVAEFERQGGRQTSGRRLHDRYGVTGARGEAAAGFPHVRYHSLPVLERLLREGRTLEEAGAVALLHLMAEVEDSNVIARADPVTLRSLQREVRALLGWEREVERLLAGAGT